MRAGTGAALAAGMTLTRMALVVVVVTSSAALSEEPLLTPTWSLGAGLSFGSAGAYGLGGLVGATPGGLGGTVGGLSVGYGYPSVAPNVSLERQFSTRFALGLGLEAGVNTSSTVGATRPSPASGSAAIGISPRFTLTSESAPVAFTVLATAFAGYGSSGGVVAVGAPALGVEAAYSVQTLSVGVLGGIALEKRFFDGSPCAFRRSSRGSRSTANGARTRASTRRPAPSSTAGT